MCVTNPQILIVICCIHLHIYISHVKNSIRYSQFLWLRRLCSEDPDFPLKSEEMCDFFHKRGYPTSFHRFKRAIIVPNKLIGSHYYKRHRRKKMIELHSTSWPSCTFQPHNHTVKSIIKKTKLHVLQNDPDTGRIFSQSSLISFKRDKTYVTF